jgi:hypothetical protein
VAKSKKAAKPKSIQYERVSVKHDTEGLYPTLTDLVRTYRADDLGEAKFAFAWRLGWKPNAEGKLTLGKCKKATDLDREFNDVDFVILLNAEMWKRIKDDFRRAIIHHELEHATVARDSIGEIKRDERGRPVYRVRGHDLEEFRSIVSLYGCYKADIEEFVREALNSPKPPAPTLFDDAPAKQPEPGSAA